MSVWPTAVLRGDTAPIVIGEDSTSRTAPSSTSITGCRAPSARASAIGHRAIIHGATVEHDSLIGMGAILLNNVVVGTGSIVGAGAVCPEGMIIPPNSLVLGVPGRVVRKTTDAERERIAKTVQSYLALQDAHGQGSSRAELLACQLSSSPF